jgi:uncharacterized protein
VTFLDCESRTDRARLENPEYYLSNLKGLIIIDEIQMIPALFAVLRIVVDSGDSEKRFLILGSASPILLKNVPESSAGRVESIEISGFCLEESGALEWERLWIRGGFPRSFLALSEDDSIAWREDFVRAFLERDIPQLGIAIPAAALHRFWTPIDMTYPMTEKITALSILDLAQGDWVRICSMEL